MKNRSLKKLFTWLTIPAERMKKVGKRGYVEHRPVLDNILFGKKWAVTADGFTAHYVHYPTEEQRETYDTETNELLQERGVKAFTSDAEFTNPPPETNVYPDMLYVIPTEKPQCKFLVNAQYLIDALKCCLESKTKQAKITIYKNTITVQGKSNDLDTYSLIMQMKNHDDDYWQPD